MNELKFRAWNIIEIYAKEAILQVRFTKIGPACLSSVVILPKDLESHSPDYGLAKRKKVYEFKPWQCSNLDTHTVEWPNYPFETLVQDEENKILVKRTKDGNLKIAVTAPAINLHAKLLLNLNKTQDMMFVAPLSNDKKNYFVNQKVLPISVSGEFFYDQKRFSCGENYLLDCLAYVDNGRG